MNPDQTQEYDQLNTEIETLDSEVRALQPTPGGRNPGIEISSSVEQPQDIELNLPNRFHESRWAKFRLSAIPWLAYGFLALLLAGAGFNELYVENATFGSNPVGDYLAILSWGLAAEATREGLTSAAKGLNIPSFQEQP